MRERGPTAAADACPRFTSLVNHLMKTLFVNLTEKSASYPTVCSIYTRLLPRRVRTLCCVCCCAAAAAAAAVVVSGVVVISVCLRRTWRLELKAVIISCFLVTLHPKLPHSSPTACAPSPASGVLYQ